MDDESEEGAEPIDRIEAKLDRLLAGQERILECLKRLDKGQDTVVTRLNALHQRKQ